MTLVDGGVAARGWRTLTRAPSGTARPARPSGRDGGRTLAVLAHLSDLHLCDAESPARLEHLERHGQFDAPFAAMLGDIGTWRPQEFLTAHVGVAMAERLLLHPFGPATGAPYDATLVTGDLVDNAQGNEFAWFCALAMGGAIEAWSGTRDRSSWIGAPDAPWDPHVWHPEGHPGGVDHWVARLGFPRIEGLLAAARRTIVGPGFPRPVVSVHGNHDQLLQGTVPVDASLRTLALGTRRIVDLDPDRSPLAVLEAIPAIGPARYLHGPSSPAVAVVADPRREPLTPAAVRRLGAVGVLGAPAAAHRMRRGPGHAFSVAVGPEQEVRIIALDTVNPHGGWQGSIPRAQFDWFVSELDGSEEPHLVVASHHPSWCLVNGFRPRGGRPRVLAEAVVAAALAEPRVVAWLAGHVHRHALVLHRSGSRVLPELTTASLIDWPQQGRAVELIRRPDGSIRLVVSALDHAGSVRPEGHPLDTVGTLAGWSRLLARNAPRARPGGHRRSGGTRVAPDVDLTLMAGSRRASVGTGGYGHGRAEHP